VLQTLIPDEVRVCQDERVVFLQGTLHEQGDRALRGVEVRVGIDTAGLRQVIHDDRGIGDAYASILYERQLAPGRLAGIGRVDDLVRNARYAQPGLELAAERAEVRDSEHARKLEQLNGLVHGVCHALDPSKAAAWANVWRRRPQSPVLSKMVRISSRRAP
jgi:hypothetical protein